MRLEELPEKRLLLHSTDSLRPKCSFIIAPHSDDQLVQWKDDLHGILQRQYDLMRNIIGDTNFD